MLKVIFNYEGEQPIFESLRSLNFKYEDNTYILNETFKAEIVHDSAIKRLILTFSKELSFDQYKQLHKIIKKLATRIHASIDDQLALMGYLEDGNEAYIFHGWNSWVQYLEGAKHVSMEGQKVEVYEDSDLIEKGILLATKKDNTINDDFNIIECTLITKYGERTIKGTKMRIVATGEF